MSKQAIKHPFYDIVRVIEQASAKELIAIARVEKAITETSSRGRVDPRTGMTSSPNAGNNANCDFQSVITVAPTVDGYLSISNDPNNDHPNSAIQRSGTDKASCNTTNTNIATNTAMSSNVTTTTNTQDLQTNNQVVDNSIVNNNSKTSNQNSTPSVTVTVNSAGTEKADKTKQNRHYKATEQEQKKTNELLDGLYKDSQEQRQASGAVASRKQKETNAEQDKETEEDNNSSVKSLSDLVTDDTRAANDNRIIDGAGVSVFSSWWLAGKEVSQLLQESRDFIVDNNLNSKDGIEEKFNGAKSAIKDPKAALKDYFNKREEQVPVVQPIMLPEKVASETLALEVQTTDQSAPEKSASKALAPVTDDPRTANNNRVIDGIGVSAFSSWWLAGKEISQLLQESRDFIAGNDLNSRDGIKEKFNSAKSAIKDPKAALKDYFNKREEQVPVVPPIMAPEKAVSKPLALPPATSAAAKMTLPALLPQGESSGKQAVATSANNTSIDSSASSAAAIAREDANTKPLVEEEIAEQTSVLSLDNAKQLELLDLIHNAIGSISNGSSSGLFGDDGIDLERKKKKGKKNKKKGGKKRGRNRRGKRGKKFGRVKGMKSILSTSGELASGVSKLGAPGSGLLSKGAGIGSKFMGGAKFLAKGAGKMFPLLAPAMSMYDAFSGFTDTERQKEVFDLQDGQEATTGQKTSMALANFLDMGGLVSGSAGMVGDLMGAMGFEGAQEALTFDTDSMTKGIYSLFGGETSEQKKEQPVQAASEQRESEDKTKQDQPENGTDTSQLTTNTSTTNSSEEKTPTASSINESIKQPHTGTTSRAITSSTADFDHSNTNPVFERTDTRLTKDSKSLASAQYTGPITASLQGPTKAPNQPVTVLAQSDPKLTQTMTELLKVTKENKGQTSAVNNTNKSVTNITAQNKGGDSGIPMGPNDIQLQLIALDAN